MKYSMIRIVSWLYIGFQGFATVHSFATPNTDFLLTIDENSVAVGHEHTCVIEQKHGENNIGGPVTCWGAESDSGRDEAPSDVSIDLLLAFLKFELPLYYISDGICSNRGWISFFMWNYSRSNCFLLGKEERLSSWFVQATDSF